MIKLLSQKKTTVYSSLGEEDRDLEQCTEAQGEIQVVVHGHCNKGPATLDRQVGHTPGLLDVEPVGVGREHQEQGYDREVVVVMLYKGTEGGHKQALQIAQEADSMMFGSEDVEHFEDLMEAANWIFDGAGLLQDSCKSLNSYDLGNLVQPFVSAHLQSFLDTGYFWSSQNHCTAV